MMTETTMGVPALALIALTVLGAGLIAERIRPARFTEADRLAEKQLARTQIRGTR